MEESFIEIRFRNFINTLPVSKKSEFRTYYRAVKWKEGLKFSVVEDIDKNPIWFSLPILLMNKYQSYSYKDINLSQYLKDILWAQYCIFMSVRIKDDVLDFDVDKNLLFISELFLDETKFTLLKYFKESSQFWKTFNQLIDETNSAMHKKSSAIILQNTSNKELLKLNGCESSILNVGTLAICTKFQQLNHYLIIKEFIFHWVVAYQIIDDLFDLEEDLRNGYFNFVARLLISNNTIKNRSNEDVLNLAANSFIATNTVNQILVTVRKRIDLASTIIKPLKIDCVEKYIISLINYVNMIEKEINKKRVNNLFKYEYTNFIESL